MNPYEMSLLADSQPSWEGGMSLISANPEYEKYVGLHPKKTENFVAVKHDDPYKGYSKPKDSSVGKIDDTEQVGTDIKYTAESIKHYATAVADIMKGGAAIANGYISKMSTDAKRYTYEFQADQNVRAANMLLKNQTDVTRAAQMDSTRFKIQGVETKAKQKTAMAGSGFAVGKGIYKNTLNTTDARINYNVANLMLKADLENAETTRRAGTLKAQAIIDETNAKIAKKQGEAAVLNGWISGISNFISAGASFYCGKVANGDFATKSTTTTGKGK